MTTPVTDEQLAEWDLYFARRAHFDGECACRGLALLAEVARLRAALEKYADHYNWTARSDALTAPQDVFRVGYHGWQLAERALRGEE